MPRKYYRHDQEVEITATVPFGEQYVRYCESPVFQMVPGCTQAFYSCEYERVYGTQKHVPGFSWFNTPKKGTMISCRDMPAVMCQNRIDVNTMHCPHCGCKLPREVDNEK